MKSIIFFSAIIIGTVMTMSSCSKQSTTTATSGKYYMRFKANGVQKNYLNALMYNHIDSVTSYPDDKIYGYPIGAGLDAGVQTLQLVIYSKAGTGTYTGVSLDSTYFESDLINAYQSRVLATYTQGLDPVHPAYLSPALFVAAGELQAPLDWKISITGLTTTTITGTFSGTVYGDNLSNDQGTIDDKIVITEGEFSLPVPSF